MSDELNLEKAKKIFEKFCLLLDKDGWNYKKNEEELRIETGIQGDDLPVDISITFTPDIQIFTLYSVLPFVIKEDKRLDMAIAVSAVNNRLFNGSFEYDIKSGYMLFRISNSYMGSELSENLFSHLMLLTYKTVEKYNDKFMMISAGMLSVEDFINEINN